MAATGSRLVIVSDRIAPAPDAQAGGLPLALHDALAASGGLWFGWSGHTADHPADAPTLSERDGIGFATIDLAPADRDTYERFCQRALRPVFHYRADLAGFERSGHSGYMRVNARFATALFGLLRSDDLVWVHDHHVIAVGQELRRLGAGQRLGFFLHTPFPATEVLLTLPTHRELVRALFAYDLVGFQSPRDLRAFHDYVATEAGGRVFDDGRVSAFGRMIRADVFPIGIDADALGRLAASPEAARHVARLRAATNGNDVIIGVDRLEHSKGLLERFAAFEALLANHPDTRGHVHLLQIMPPSRGDLVEEAKLRRQIEAAAGRINGRFAEFDWTPICHLNRRFSRRVLAALYRASRVGLVTPLQDGMSVVAKEYVAAQAEAAPGVLVLSRFAGAAHQLDGALIVNPHDPQGVADAIQVALTMNLEERRKRWRSMMSVLRHEGLTAWRTRFLGVLAGTSPIVPFRRTAAGAAIRPLPAAS